MNDSKSTGRSPAKPTLSYFVCGIGSARWRYQVLIDRQWLMSVNEYNSHNLAELAMFKLSQKLGMKPKEHKK